MKHKIITAIPFFMLFITATSAYCSYLDYYNNIFIYLGDLFGYSITTNIVFVFLYFRKSFCIQTKIAVLSLLLMNVISVIFAHNNIIYNGVYDLWITMITLIMIMMTILK